MLENHEWLTLEESASILRIDKRTLTRKIKDGTIPLEHIRILGTDQRPQYRIHRSYVIVE